ncbi:MAG: GNAT family N-acetyltransferase [Gammaproteobacteria bacterium]|nr:MAG: GNAT family N-acetyltransferase [Gammaproteobacteria bacterium]
MFNSITPQSLEEFEKYYQLRWQILRKPWQQPLGSEQDELEQQACHRMLVDKKNNVLAVARLHKTSQHQAQIRYMAVTENQQGLGLGKQLIQTLEDEASKQGITEIVLNAREQALKFYQKQGYQQLNFAHQLYGEINHYVMKKNLSTHVDHQTKLAQQLQSIWHDTIPLSKAMNIELSFYDKRTLITSCEPTFNKNLHNTMFAGSIYTLATLTGWGWVYMQLEQKILPLPSDIVLAEGKIRYLAPITGIAHARTSVDLTSDNIEVLQLGKKARFTIKVEVCNGDNIAAIFEGLYVAIPCAKNNKLKQ